jgi:hypothetical protein
MRKMSVNFAYLRDSSTRLLEGAAAGLLAKRGYQLSPPPSEAAVKRPHTPRDKLDKKELIDYVFTRCSPRPTSFADLGGVWGVEGEYTFYALETHRPEHAFLVDGTLTAEVIAKAREHQELQLLNGNFGTDSIATKVTGVDAVFLFDVLLHQVNPDWEGILGKYAAPAKYLLIYNQQWTGKETVRLLDLGE